LVEPGAKRPDAEFLQQVVMKKCFFLNPEKILVHISAVLFKKTEKTAQL